MHAAPRLPGHGPHTTSELADVCVCAALRLLSRFASLELARALMVHDATITDFHLLVALATDPGAQMPLARTLHLNPSAVSRVVTRLAERGQVESFLRGRRARWRLTAAGCSTLDFLRLAWAPVDRDLRQALGQDLVKPLLLRADRMPPRHRVPNGAWWD